MNEGLVTNGPLPEIDLSAGLMSFVDIIHHAVGQKLLAAIYLMMKKTDGRAGEGKGFYRAFFQCELMLFAGKHGLDGGDFDRAWKQLLAVEFVRGVSEDQLGRYAVARSLAVHIAGRAQERSTTTGDTTA